MTAALYQCDRPGCTFSIIDGTGNSLAMLDQIDEHEAGHTQAAGAPATYDCEDCGFHVVDWSDDPYGFDEAVAEHEDYHRHLEERAAADDVVALAEVVTPHWSNTPKPGPDVYHASPAHARRRRRTRRRPPRGRSTFMPVPALGIALVLALAVALALGSLVVGFASVTHPVLRGVGAVLGVWALLLVALVVRAAGRSS